MFYVPQEGGKYCDLFVSALRSYGVSTFFITLYNY